MFDDTIRGTVVHSIVGATNHALFSRVARIESVAEFDMGSNGYQLFQLRSWFYASTAPPSTARSAPVMCQAASDATNATTRPMSAGSGMRSVRFGIEWVNAHRSAFPMTRPIRRAGLVA